MDLELAKREKEPLVKPMYYFFPGLSMSPTGKFSQMIHALLPSEKTTFVSPSSTEKWDDFINPVFSTVAQIALNKDPAVILAISGAASLVMYALWLIDIDNPHFKKVILINPDPYASETIKTSSELQNALSYTGRSPNEIRIFLRDFPSEYSQGILRAFEEIGDHPKVHVLTGEKDTIVNPHIIKKFNSRVVTIPGFKHSSGNLAEVEKSLLGIIGM